MRKTVLIVLLPQLVAACNSEWPDDSTEANDGSDSGSNTGSTPGEIYNLADVTLKQPGFTLNAASRAAVDSQAAYYIGDYNPESVIEDPIKSDNWRSTARDLTEKSLPRVSPRFNGNETEECDSGTVSWTLVADGFAIGSDQSSSQGNLSMSTAFNDCRLDVDNGDYSLQKGRMALAMNWTGMEADGSDYETFNAKIGYSGYSFQNVAGGASETHTMDGAMTIAADQKVSRLAIALALSSTATGGEAITLETTSDLVHSHSDTYPSSGTLVVSGSKGTQIVYTVVPNGVEVSLNDGQAELIPWSELDSE